MWLARSEQHPREKTWRTSNGLCKRPGCLGEGKETLSYRRAAVSLSNQQVTAIASWIEASQAAERIRRCSIKALIEDRSGTLTLGGQIRSAPNLRNEGTRSPAFGRWRDGAAEASNS
jgi:hypothetical protein